MSALAELFNQAFAVFADSGVCGYGSPLVGAEGNNQTGRRNPNRYRGCGIQAEIITNMA
jgi:hypothetical protein